MTIGKGTSRLEVNKATNGSEAPMVFTQLNYLHDEICELQVILLERLEGYLPDLEPTTSEKTDKCEEYLNIGTTFREMHNRINSARKCIQSMRRNIDMSTI